MALAFALAAPAAGPAGAAGTDPAPDRRQRPPLVRVSRGDAWFGVVAVAATGAAAFGDRTFRERALAGDGDGTRRLARVAEPFGAPEVLGPALVLGYLAGRALDRPALAAASARVGVPVAVAALATGAIKLAVGRVRPEDAAAEPDAYRPFSGHASFPSGHAALAFAAATALDRETEAGWVPWVAYPIAGLVGWSRVRDDRHWTSDVVAGAALGTWTAAKTHDALRARGAFAGRVGLGLVPGDGGSRMVARVAF